MMIVTVNFVMAMMMTTTTTSKAKEKTFGTETLVLQWVLNQAHFNLMLTPSSHNNIIIINNNYKIYIALNLNKYPKALYNSIDKNVL